MTLAGQVFDEWIKRQSEGIVIEFPEHKCSLTLTHNDHLDVYEKLEEKLQDEYYKDMTPEDKAECIRTNSLWTLHWYPRTPVSFYVVHGPTLERVLELAKEAI